MDVSSESGHTSADITGPIVDTTNSSVLPCECMTACYLFALRIFLHVLLSLHCDAGFHLCIYSCDSRALMTSSASLAAEAGF